MELAILTGDKERGGGEKGSVPENIQLLLIGDLEAVLNSSVSKEILKLNSGTNTETSSLNLENLIVENVNHFLSKGSEGNVDTRELELLLLAVASLHLFIQNNWLGPLTSKTPADVLCLPLTTDKEIQEKALSYLSEDGEPAYNLTRYAGFLQISRVILLECRHRCAALQTWDWWLARCLSVQQSILDQRSPTLRETILEALENTSKKETLMDDEKNRDVAVLFHTEASRMVQVYWEDKKAREHVNQARKLAGVQVELTGALGKRTKFQQEHKAQLIVKVTRDVGEQTLPHVGLCNPLFSGPVPKRLALDDDTVLDQINFQDEEANQVTQLSPVEQALLLAVMESHRRAVAQEKLTDEEISTYLGFIISQVSSWSVAVAALVIRCRLECKSRRRVERSMQQLEEMVNQIQKAEPASAARLSLFHAARPPTSWALQSELATVLLSLGVVSSALDIYERLHMWEDAIALYQQMGKREKAETVIREQLAIKETPTLLCFLGDVTRDKGHYLRAWELSNQRSARAMRCLAYVYFTEEKFDEAVDCFEKSLAINGLQIPVWFTCGCACMSAKKYESAVRAFKRCVNIDYDNFEAWSNLATAYARLKKVRMAFLTVKDALKCNFESWRLWENCLLFATDCGEFGEVIQAYHHLIDLKQKWTDIEVLGILVKAVTTNLADAGGTPSAHLHPKLMELFGRITATVTSEGEIWKLYADLSRAETENHQPEIEKAAQFLQKSQRCATQKPDWEKDPEQCKKITEQSLQLAETQLSCVQQMDNGQQALQMLASSKFMLKGVASKIRLKHTDPMSKELPEPMKSLCASLDQQLEAVISKTEQLRVQ